MLRLDFKKLENICGQHIAASEDAALLHEFETFLKVLGHEALTDLQRTHLSEGMYCLKDRAKTLIELADKAQFIMVSRPIFPDETSAASLSSVFIGILRELTPQLQNGKWDKENLERILTAFAEHHGIGFGKLAAPLRAALAGSSVTPSVYDMMLVLGRDETIARLADVCILKP